ncbi:hypothetical protein ABT369_39005 [Dactylosporangium sp. NPDC000244]|uniref:hypothetical protein n=1 Tax=Dactylosporangium sp. NPDC000244 TaxID=3154365 RepID=UPI003331BB4F
MSAVTPVAAAVIEYRDGRAVPVTAVGADEVAALRLIAHAEGKAGKSRIVATVGGVPQSIAIDHAELAAVRLVTS